MIKKQNITKINLIFVAISGGNNLNSNLRASQFHFISNMYVHTVFPKQQEP